MSGSGIRDRDSMRPVTAIVGAAIVIALLLSAYLGTGLSMTVEEYAAVEIPFVGVGFNVAVKNDGLFTQTKTVHCEVRTTDGVYDTSKEVTLGAGERTNLYMVIPILGLDTSDIREKRCSTSLL